MPFKQVEQEHDIVKIVNDLIAQAIIQGASDIHFEPQPTELVIRYRVDGVLHVIAKEHISVSQLILARVKIMCQIDTTGLPRPQEGNIKFIFGEKNVDLRVSIFPTSYGECVVMRVLESVKMYKKFEDLGFLPEQASQVEESIKKPFGLILVTGPTGSGKSTTLFTMLDRMNEASKSVVTLEDPVERKLEMVRQTQVNPEQGLTFASGLRYLLRQDPNIIMVGEIRDRETAEIAVQAAITGSLVLSTIHTNSAAGAVVRLVNMGIEPFLLASALRFVTAQRLALVNCPDCIEEYIPPMELLGRLDLSEGAKFYRSAGCVACSQKGVKGRIGIHEVLPVTKEIADLIISSPSDDKIAAMAVNVGMINLRRAAIQKALDGIISIEEVLRLTE
jgi:type IV pilus assembly protein PilB